MLDKHRWSYLVLTNTRVPSVRTKSDFFIIFIEQVTLQFLDNPHKRQA